MTKSDYELVANTLRAHYAPKERGDFGDMEEQNRQEISLALGLAFEENAAIENPHLRTQKEISKYAFDLTQFLKECEL